jgi:hypothetical protein
MTTTNEAIAKMAETCGINDVNLTDLYCEFANVMAAEITEGGEIEYSADGETNWLVATDEQAAEFINWVNNS